MTHVLAAVAWPYANGPRHIGHVAGFGVPSDVFSRYMRMAGHEVLMVSGTDEHGTPILIALALAWARAREIIAACQCDTGREPSPAERPYVCGIPQVDRYPDDAEEAWVLLVCAECGRTDCTHGAVALHEAALHQERTTRP